MDTYTENHFQVAGTGEQERGTGAWDRQVRQKPRLREANSEENAAKSNSPSKLYGS